MRLSPRQRLILTGVLRDMRHYAALEPRYGREWAIIVERERIEEARGGFVQTAPAAWLNKSLTASDHTMIGRDYHRLESLGLLERCNLRSDGNYTTHLRLTPAGIMLADNLEREVADVAASLNSTGFTDGVTIQGRGTPRLLKS